MSCYILVQRNERHDGKLTPIGRNGNEKNQDIISSSYVTHCLIDLVRRQKNYFWS